MSQLTQFMGGGSTGSSNPKGSITTQMPFAASALLETNGEFYVKTGTRVTGMSSSVRNTINSATDDFTLPVSRTVLAASQNNSTRVAHSFVYGNSVYLRGTPLGLVRSTDGISWTPVEITGDYASNALNEPVCPASNIVFGAGIFLVVIDWVNGSTSSVTPGSYTIASSTDGLTWALSPVNLQLTGEPGNSNGQVLAWVGLDFDGTNFWLTTHQQDSNSSIFYIQTVKSVDGKNWTLVGNYNTGSGSWPYAKWKVVNNGTNVVWAPCAWTASSSTAFTAYGTPTAITAATNIYTEPFTQMKYLNSLFVGLRNGAAGSNTTSALATSPTGVTFTGRTLPIATWLYDVTFGNSTYVAVGVSGHIFTSPTGTTWTQQTSGTTENLISVEWDATLSLFICVGATTIRTSSDGVTWSAATIPSGLGTRNISYIQIPGSCALLSKLNGTWFTSIGSSDHIISSTNGTTWTASFVGGSLSNSANVIPGSSAQSSNNALFKLNTLIVACPAAGGIMVAPLSTNSWTLRAQPSAGIFNAVAYGAGLYVAVGNTGVIYTSSDGTTWTSRTSGTATNLTGISWSGSEFIAISSTVAIRSTDGITWASAGSNGGTFICYSGGKFIVYTTSTLRTSATGVTWSSTSCPAFSQMRAFSGGAVIFASTSNVLVVGSNGTRVIPTTSTVDGFTEINGNLYLSSSTSSGFYISVAPTYGVGSPTAQPILSAVANGNPGTSPTINSFQSSRSGVKVGSNTYTIATTSSIQVGAVYDMSVFTAETCRMLSSGISMAFYNGADVWASETTLGITWAPKAMACSLSQTQSIWASNISSTYSTLTNQPLPMIGYRKIT